MGMGEMFERICEQGDCMVRNELLETLWKERIKTALDITLLTNEEYMMAEEQASDKLKCVLSLGVSNEQMKAVREMADGYSFSMAEYGNVAYKQGFLDGIRLLSEIENMVGRAKNK